MVVVVVGRTVVVVTGGGTAVVVVTVVDVERLVVVVVVVVVVLLDVVALVDVGGWLFTTAGSGSGALAVPSPTADRSLGAASGGPPMRPSTSNAAVIAPTIAPAASRV